MMVLYVFICYMVIKLYIYMDGLMWFHKDKKGTITRYGYGFTLRPGCFLMPELAMEMDYFPASQGLWFRVNGLMGSYRN